MQDKDIVTFSSSSAVFLVPITTSKIQSKGATPNSGYRLYLEGGESTLEVDNLIVRNENSDSLSANWVTPQYWYYNNNIIVSVEEFEDSEDTSEIKYEITLKYKN